MDESVPGQFAPSKYPHSSPHSEPLFMAHYQPGRRVPQVQPPAAPFPVEATNPSAGVLLVRFNEPIQNVPIDAGNWSINGLTVTNAQRDQFFENRVRLDFDPPDPPVNVSYSPPPFDVLSSVTGIAAEPFAGFPVS